MPSIPMIVSIVALAQVGGEARASPAPATVTVTAKPAGAAAKDDPPMICKRTEVTGTRFTTRECRTQAEWTALTTEARSFTDRMTTGPCMGGCRAR